MLERNKCSLQARDEEMTGALLKTATHQFPSRCQRGVLQLGKPRGASSVTAVAQYDLFPLCYW